MRERVRPLEHPDEDPRDVVERPRRRGGRRHPEGDAVDREHGARRDGVVVGDEPPVVEDARLAAGVPVEAELHEAPRRQHDVAEVRKPEPTQTRASASVPLPSGRGSETGQNRSSAPAPSRITGNICGGGLIG